MPAALDIPTVLEKMRARERRTADSSPVPDGPWQALLQASDARVLAVGNKVEVPLLDLVQALEVHDATLLPNAQTRTVAIDASVVLQLPQMPPKFMDEPQAITVEHIRSGEMLLAGLGAGVAAAAGLLLWRPHLADFAMVACVAGGAVAAVALLAAWQAGHLQFFVQQIHRHLRGE